VVFIEENSLLDASVVLPESLEDNPNEETA